jgi:hypothetical protein
VFETHLEIRCFLTCGRVEIPPPCPSGHGSPVSMKDVTETKNVHGSRKLDPMTPKGSGYGARKLDPMDVTMAS